MEAITQVVSRVAAQTATLDGGAEANSHGDSTGTTGDGDGDTLGLPVVARWERWRVSLQAANAKRFGVLLDELNVHIGVLGGGDPVI